MPTMKAKLLTHRKERNADDHIMELKPWIVPVTECTPHGLKYSPSLHRKRCQGNWI